MSQRRLQQQRDPILVDDHTSTHGNNGRKTTPFNGLSDGCNFDYSHGSWTTTNGHPFHECLSSFIESFLGITFISIAFSGIVFLLSRCAICIAGFLMIFCTGRSRFRFYFKITTFISFHFMFTSRCCVVFPLAV